MNDSDAIDSLRAENERLRAALARASDRLAEIELRLVRFEAKLSMALGMMSEPEDDDAPFAVAHDIPPTTPR